MKEEILLTKKTVKANISIKNIQKQNKVQYRRQAWDM